MALNSFRECARAAPLSVRKRRFWPAEFVSDVAPSEVLTDPKILTSLMAQLGWTHLLHQIRLEDPLKRDFYAEMCRIERWSTRMLEKKIGGMLFELTALSKKPEKLAVLEHKQLVAALSAEPSACEWRNILAV